MRENTVKMRTRIIPNTDTFYVLSAEAVSGLVKLVVITNAFFNNQQHEIKTKRFICSKQSRFFSKKGN